MQSEKYYNYINYKDLIFLNQLKGLFLINKPLAISLGINFLSLAGIPPLAGFFAKAWIFLSLIKFSDWSTA
jgi:NADH:ubiquinone oxidoreductase subunit 2 (subunit N)